MVMMTYVIQAGTGFREIPDSGNTACSLMPESSNDHVTGSGIISPGQVRIRSCSSQVK